ncbi:uncharacterized protein LOC126456043 [Schistocerca serialis cubense]|uniref:uncharacterized protein LOC126456043 n=1 Tax=Schistocerca serialis cubense TaxID=2023355 RepID=UPI00214E9104|nr:uncharacterized protein LOC126456043 [Schistocerca serialis cubense]
MNGNPHLNGSKTTAGAGAALAAGAGVTSPELENVPLSTPPYLTQLPPPTPRRRRPGNFLQSDGVVGKDGKCGHKSYKSAALASPMVVLSRGWLRRHRPAVLITASVLGAAVLVVLLAALAYHVTPSTVSEDYELDIEEESGNVEVSLGHRVIEEEFDTSRPLVVEANGTIVEPPTPKDVEREETQPRVADDSILVPRLVEEGNPEHTPEIGAVLRDAVKSFRSPSRSRRHRTDDSFAADPPTVERFADKPSTPQGLASKQGSHISGGAVDVTYAHRTNEGPSVDARPNVIKVTESTNGQGKELWKWAALPFDHTYDIELDEIGNSVSETIKRAGGTEKPVEYAREYILGSDARHQSKVTGIESNSVESSSFQSGTPQEPEESVVRTLRKWPLNHPLGRQERLVTVIKIPGVIRRQKRGVRPESDVRDQNLIQRVRRRDAILGSLFRKLNGKSSPSNDKGSFTGDARRFNRRTPFRSKRQVYWGPFYDPHNRFHVDTESVEDSSSEDVSDNDVDHLRSPYSWFYTPQTFRARSPYGYPATQYWSWYHPHSPYYRNGAHIGQPDFYQARSFQDVTNTEQRSRHYEGGEVSGPEEADSQSRQMEKALETSVVAPVNISPELFARVIKSETPAEFAKHLRELTETHLSNLRQSLPDENRRRLEGFTNVLSALDEQTVGQPQSDSFIARSSEAAAAVAGSENETSAANSPQQQPTKAFQQHTEEMESTESSSEEEAVDRSAEPGLEKLFTADGIVKLINVLPSDTITKIIESLSAEAFADLLKGLSKEEIMKIKNSLPPEKLEAIKKMFSPEELEEVRETLGIKSNATSAPAYGQTATEVPESLTSAASEEASLDYSDGGPGASTYAPLTVVPESSTVAALVDSQDPAEEAEPRDESARSFLRRNGTGFLVLKQLRPGLLQQTVAAMNSPVAAAGMSQLAVQDQRVGREMDAGNPLDAVLAATSQPQPQRQHRADTTDAILSTLTALAEDVHWIRVQLASSNMSIVGAARSSLLEAELESARRSFIKHTAVSGKGLTPLDRERLAALPDLADQLKARQAGNAIPKIIAADYPTGMEGDYAGAVEATASTAYTVTSPGLDATTPKTWAHGQYMLTAKPGITVPEPNTGIHFPSQPSGTAFQNGGAHKTLDGGQLVALPIHSGGQHVPLCIYGHQQQQQQQQPPPLVPAWPLYRQAPPPPQAAAYASAVAIVPQPQLIKADDKVEGKDLPVLHHQQNVYNYYSGAGLPWQHASRPQTAQQQQPLLQPVICGWAPPSPEQQIPLHSHTALFQPYLNWRLHGQAGVDAATNLQQSAVLQVQTTKSEEAGVKQRTTVGEAVFTQKPLVEAPPPSARDSHLGEGKSGLGEASGDSQLFEQSQNQSTSAPAPPADSTREWQAPATGSKHRQNATTRDPCCGGTTDAAGESQRANVASEKHDTEDKQRFASEIRPLQGTHAAILSGLAVTPTVPVLSSTGGNAARNR